MNHTSDNGVPDALPRSILLKVFARAFWIQATWSPTGMQNLGMAYALWPALKTLYPDASQRRQAVERHVTTFNTHPYLASAIVGGVLHHEERIARGEGAPGQVLAFKALLMGPLAALGDGFFWYSLRPAFGALAVLLSLVIGLWSVPVTLLLYNVIHLWARTRLFYDGYQKGDAVLGTIAQWRFSERRTPLRWLSAACLGAFGALLLLKAPRIWSRLDGFDPSHDEITRIDVSTAWPWLIGAIALSASVLFLEQRHLNPYALVFGAALLCFTAGALTWNDSPHVSRVKFSPPAMGLHGFRSDRNELKMSAFHLSEKTFSKKTKEHFVSVSAQGSFLIVNTLGLHARAAAQLVKLSGRFYCDVYLEKDEQEVNGKSIMGVLMLAATKGSTVNVRTEGDDAEEALIAIGQLFQDGFGEDR